MAVRFTPLAQPLLDFVEQSRRDLSSTAASLLTPINYNADLFGETPVLLTGNGTDAASQHCDHPRPPQNRVVHAGGSADARMASSSGSKAGSDSVARP